MNSPSGTETEVRMYHMHEICPGGSGFNMAGGVCVSVCVCVAGVVNREYPKTPALLWDGAML